MLIQNRLPVCIIDGDEHSQMPGLIRGFGFNVDNYSSTNDFLATWTPRPSCVVINTDSPGTQSHRFFEFAASHSFLTIVLVGIARPDHCTQCTQRQVFSSIRPPYHPEHLNEIIQRALDAAAASWEQHVCKEQFDRLYASLSPRESEVYEHILRGLENKRVAAALGISCSTIEKHRLSIVRKMGVQSPIQLVLQKYVATGAITDDRLTLQTAELGLPYPTAIPEPRMPTTHNWGPSSRTQASMRSIN